MKKTRFLLLSSMLLVSAAAVADIRQSTLSDRKELDITIYNQDLALVKDRRAVRMNTGSVILAFRDISAGIRPETVLLRSMTSPASLHVNEQNVDQDILTPQKLLERHVGAMVGVVRVDPATGTETSERAQLLSSRDGVVLKIGNRIETNPPGRIVFDDIPAGLSDKPTLMFSLDNRGAGNQEIELGYLTGGLSWKADYVAELSSDDSRADLSGWFTITNSSGSAFHNARVRLVAGDVGRAYRSMTMAAMSPVAKSAPSPENAPSESLSDYKLYTIDRPVSILENQTKQIALLSATDVPVRREWVLHGNDYYYRNAQSGAGQKMKIGIFIELDNRKGGGLGVPLPKGTLRIYQRDARGNLQFIGEDNLNHTPVNETVRLKLGDAFDIGAQRRQTSFTRLPGDGVNEYASESAHEVVLKNAKKEAVTVIVREPVPGDWTILDESHPHEKTASNEAVWRIRVPAEGRAVLSYRSRVRY